MCSDPLCRSICVPVAPSQRAGSVARLHVTPVCPSFGEPATRCAEHCAGAGAGGNGSKGGDVTQGSETSQSGDNNSGKNCLLSALPADGGVTSACSEDEQASRARRLVLATVTCLQQSQRRRQMPAAATVGVAR